MGVGTVMRLAQRLYDGSVSVAERTGGLITYMRTDGTHMSEEAVAAVRAHVSSTLGAEWLPETPRRFSKKRPMEGTPAPWQFLAIYFKRVRLSMRMIRSSRSIVDCS